MMGVSILDWVILLIMVLSVLQASAQGFFYEFFSLAGVIVGYLLAAWEYPRVAVWYAPHVNSRGRRISLGSLPYSLWSWWLAGVLGRIARWAVHGVGLRWFDRVLGGAFGFLRGAVACTVLCWRWPLSRRSGDGCSSHGLRLSCWSAAAL